MPRKKRQRAIKGTGSIYEDPTRPGSWLGQVTIKGHRYRVRGTSAMQARDKLNDIIANPPAPAKTTASPIKTGPVDGLTVADLLTEWLDRDLAGRDISPATDTYHRWAARLWTDTIGHIAVEYLTVREVEAGLDQIMATARRGDDEKPLSRATLKKILSTLKQALKFGVRRGYVTTNAADSAIIPADATRTVPRQALTPDEARALLAELRRTPNGLRFGVSLLIGLRPGEAAALYWSDVDLDAGVLTVGRGLQTDQRGAAHVVDTLKVESARRSIKMPPELIDWFRDHRAEVGAVPIDGAGLIFQNDQGQLIHPTTSRAELADICRHIGIRAVKPNELRHSCASLLIDRGVAIERVADLLGHNSTRMVDLTYRHRLRPTVDAALAVDWTAAK